MDKITEKTLVSGERRGIPAGVWALGFVSMLMDISSEMIHALLPIYMVTVLGTSTLAVGIIEGIAEATASITKIFRALSATGSASASFLQPSATGLPLLPSQSFRSLPHSIGSLALASSIGSARASAARRVMHSSPTSRRQNCAAPVSACASRSTR